ncbi:MAG: VWA domain-containing protein [Pseudomonadota bacterium]|nr:VWA domain-containing protein [Pseudomonadota bacterium]
MIASLSAWLAQLDWATPWGGLLVLAPLLLTWLAWRRRRRIAHWADPHLAPWAMVKTGHANVRNWRRVFDLLAWLLLAVAAAGPRLPLEAQADGQTAARHAMTVMVVLDVSASMAAADIVPDRLARARLELADLTARLHGERLGLILYAGNAGLLLPPTDDAALFARAVQQAGPDLIEAQGTNLVAALDLAASTLNADKSTHRAVLLLTDADADSLAGTAGDAARVSAGKLAQAGIPLFILGLNSATGAPVPLPDGGYAERDGAQVVSRPAVDSYQALTGGGRYAGVQDGDGDWAALYDSGIARLPGDALPPEQARAWQALFHAPLAAALALFLLANLPKALPRALPLFLLALLLPPETNAANAAKAAEADLAWQAWQSGRYAEAQTHYTRQGGYVGQMGAGAAAWKLRDYAAAARAFSAALLLARDEKQRLDALYNLGGAHYGLGRWQTAVEAYRAILQARPNDARAAANLAEAERQAARLRSDDPAASDLRGRRGQLMQGQVNLDWHSDNAVKELEATPAGVLVDRTAAAQGARLTAEQTPEQRAEADARRLQSGLKKLELLDDRPRVLLQGLLKQDAVMGDKPMELAPW